MVGECPFSGLAGPSIRRGAATGICGGVRTATRICWVDGRQFIAFQPPDTPLHHRHRRGTRLRSLPPALPLPCTCQPPPVHRQRPSADVEKTIANREEPAHCRRGGIRHGTLFVTSRCAQSGLPHGSRRTPRVHSQREGKGEATQRERNNLLSCFSRGRARAAMHPYLGAWHGGTGQAGSGVAIPAAVHATVVAGVRPGDRDANTPTHAPESGESLPVQKLSGSWAKGWRKGMGVEGGGGNAAAVPRTRQTGDGGGRGGEDGGQPRSRGWVGVSGSRVLVPASADLSREQWGLLFPRSAPNPIGLRV